MTTKVATRNNIIHSFVENGMIDFENNRFPELNNIFGNMQEGAYS